MEDLKTNYVDDVLDTSKNQLRKYQQIQNDDGTVSFVDVTEYTQTGDSFGAKDINDTNAAVNELNGKLNESPRTLLWENADTTKSFAAQTITLPDSDYDYFEIYSVFATSGTSHNVVFKHTLLKNHIAQLFFAQYESGSTYCDKRRIISNNENISITDNDRNGSTRNDIMIPYMIYGCRS